MLTVIRAASKLRAEALTGRYWKPLQNLTSAETHTFELPRGVIMDFWFSLSKFHTSAATQTSLCFLLCLGLEVLK